MAREIADGQNPAGVKERAYADIRAEMAKVLGPAVGGDLPPGEGESPGLFGDRQYDQADAGRPPAGAGGETPEDVEAGQRQCRFCASNPEWVPAS